MLARLTSAPDHASQPGLCRLVLCADADFVDGGDLYAGRGVLPARKRRKTEGLDPVKGGFVRAPRKGGEAK